jgi:hypothetical protein
LAVHHFKHQTALQPAAYAEQARVVYRQFQLFRLLHRDRLHIREKARATEHEAARIDAAEPPRFFAYSYLAHFDPTAESTCQVSNQLSKIDPVFSRVDEGELPAIDGSIDLDQFEMDAEFRRFRSAIGSSLL